MSIPRFLAPRLPRPARLAFGLYPIQGAQATAFTTSASRRSNSEIPPLDTLGLQTSLEEAGFTSAQAHSLTKILTSTLSSTLSTLSATSLSRTEAQKTLYTQRVDFASLRSELLSTDALDSSATRSAHERLANEIEKLRSRLREEIARTQASVRLDLNLEKGRIREETGGMENQVREVEARIENEVARLREMVEGVKFATLQWLIGVTTGTSAIILGVWRLLM